MANLQYKQGSEHGGDYDPNQSHETSRNRFGDPGPSASRQAHGGDYDPNQFYASPSARQEQERGASLASEPLLQPYSASNNPWDPLSAKNAEEPAGILKDPTAIPLQAMRTPDQRDSNSQMSRQDAPTHGGISAYNSNSNLVPLHDPSNQSMMTNRSLESNEEVSGRGAKPQSEPLNTNFHHQDFLKRSFKGRRDDRFLSPKDGRLKQLVVQSVENVHRSQSSWTRTHVRNKSPWMFRIAWWTTRSDAAALKWLPASLLLTFVLMSPISVTTQTRNNGFFEPVPYKDWQYPYDARNEFENPPSKGNIDGGIRSATQERRVNQAPVGKIERISEPRYLCLADTLERIDVGKWRNDHGSGAKLEYIMVSYTSSQFPSQQDWDYLCKVGQHAAHKAGVNAFWVGCSCLGPKEEQEENVWRICDVVRGAFSIVIAVAGSGTFEDDEGQPYDLLRTWGKRVWTLPELLLSPEQDDIEVYTNRRLDSTVQIHRRNFARFWDDSDLVGQLIDHYEGSVILSPLELMTISLRCLQNRDTVEHLPGDLSYALMGLLRQRPHFRRLDSAFQAFARLSLANDSNLLLERLVCLLPHSPQDSWHSLHDHWNASLWDIYPKIQVCGIGENESIIIDGARAANIRWKSFSRVLLRGNYTWKRKLARLTLSLVGPATWLLIPLIIGGVFAKIQWIIAIGFLLIGPSILLSPYLVKTLYLGKVWSSQPWFFGVEGYMNLPDLERHMFGADLGRLSWSATGSSISRHKPVESNGFEDYCEGQDPSTYPDISARIRQAQNSTDGEEKIFTLVDTYTMTVTLFSAIKPPVAVIVCGEEGGMQRALLCSYEWTNNTFYRETVLRMETRAFWRMSPIARVRLALQSRRHLDV